MSKEDFLRELIKSRCKSVRKLSEATGIPGSTINSMLTNGIDGTGVGTVLKICRALGIRPEDLESQSAGSSEAGAGSVACASSETGLGSEFVENAELAEYLDILHKRPEMRTLFSVTKNAKKEDVEKAIKIIELFKEDKEDKDDREDKEDKA